MISIAMVVEKTFKDSFKKLRRSFTAHHTNMHGNGGDCDPSDSDSDNDANETINTSSTPKRAASLHRDVLALAPDIRSSAKGSEKVKHNVTAAARDQSGKKLGLAFPRERGAKLQYRHRFYRIYHRTIILRTAQT